ncbi:2-amino-4-hydroxy-6-hydroxymethyldihydropteridinediphosphokinase [Belliella buryatensis]|uniref:2-amino-4-hydroxy-6-hydroxymethyldihydropteridine pyrophosphokinase n=2 Tax=Belliella buryatensis TaxID=1500549 RepID=A0A239FCD6_9BACT|nr:2-amino-4-hydroxy-6-hydroxymethyldihydropteridinediphosphokinase [Belliella buryatensis]
MGLIQKNTVVLIIGGNMGDRVQLIAETTNKLIDRVGSLNKSSSIYETAAWGGNSEGAYLNQVLVLDTSLSPNQLLETIQNIENELGRVRGEKWGNRTMDIDVLYYNDLVISEEHLKVPHSYLPERKFVLIPLAEILPDQIHPILKLSNRELLTRCQDESSVDIYQKSPT